MECLQLIGRVAREPIIAHLHDKRWFFVRNLVILLRMMNDPAVLKYMGHLVGYPNSNVQFEVMRTFLHFNDPRADRYLIKKLEDAGLVLSGTSVDGELVEVVELRDHPWFVGCQFHPEFTSSPRDGHPLFKGFILAAASIHRQHHAKAQKEA